MESIFPIACFFITYIYIYSPLTVHQHTSTIRLYPAWWFGTFCYFSMYCYFSRKKMGVPSSQVTHSNIFQRARWNPNHDKIREIHGFSQRNRAKCEALRVPFIRDDPNTQNGQKLIGPWGSVGICVFFFRWLGSVEEWRFKAVNNVNNGESLTTLTGQTWGISPRFTSLSIKELLLWFRHWMIPTSQALCRACGNGGL